MDKLLTYLIELPILAYPDYITPFIPHRDASSAELGRGIFQEYNGAMRANGYGGRTLVGSEVKYHSSKFEFLVLKWAICGNFKDYLFYAPKFRQITIPDIHQN